MNIIAQPMICNIDFNYLHVQFCVSHQTRTSLYVNKGTRSLIDVCSI